MSTKSPALFPIYLINFIGTLGFSIVLPFLVIIVNKFGGNEVVYGLVGATYSGFQLVGAPILGSWSDRVGRKRVLLISQAGTFLAWLIFLWALIMPITELFEVDSRVLGIFTLTIPLLMIFGARAFDGLTGGNVSVANAYLADVTSDKDRKKNFGMMSAAANLGFIIGPVLAGLLSSTVLEEKLPVLAALFISGVAMVLISRLRESDPCILMKGADPDKVRKLLGQEHKECHEFAGDKVRFRDVLRIQHVPLMLFLYFMIFLGFNFFYVSFPVHAINELKWSLFELGVFLSITSGIMVLVQGPILSRISPRFNEATLIVTGTLLLSLGFIFYTFPQTYMLYAGMILFSTGNGLMWPSFLSVLSKVGEQRYQGAIQGYASSAGSLASILGLIIGGLLYAQFTEQVFFIPAVILFVIGVTALRLRVISYQK